MEVQVDLAQQAVASKDSASESAAGLSLPAEPAHVPLMSDLPAADTGAGHPLPDVRQSRGFLEPEPAAPAAPLAADPAEPEHREQQEPAVSGDAAPQPAAAAALPAASDGAATCAEQLEVLGMLLASPCPSSSIAPAPDHLQLPLPRDGFMCDQCGDRFVLPHSLEQHHQRRSMRVTLNCPMCQALVVFTNKCQLLEHLDAHKIDPVSIDPSLIDAAALSPTELGCIVPAAPAPDPAPTPASATPTPAPGSAPTPGAVPPNSAPGFASTPAPAPAANTKRQAKSLIKKIDRPVRVSCPMCNQLCSTLTLAEHLCPPPELDDTPLPAPPPRCPDCEQPCPTDCALMAHQGLHKPDLWPYPYACPECGVKILGTHDQALQHVVAGCLHLTRDLKTCCAICREEVEDAKTHMVQSHVQKLYKCRRCPLAFESTNGFNGHLAEKHGGVLVAGETPFMLILKCPFCAATFNNANALKDHMGSKKHGDRVLEQVSFVFRCPECELDFTLKRELSQHLTKEHPDFKPVSMILPLRAAEPPPPPTRQLGRPKVNSRLPLNPNIDPLVSPQQRAVRPPASYGCIVCKIEFKRKPEYTEHARKHLREGVPLCLLCNTRFTSSQMLKNHLADHASEVGRDRCGLCYAKLTSEASLQFHLEGEHGLRTFDCARCSLSFERLTDLNRHNFAVHRGVRGRGGRRPGANLPPARLLPEAIEMDPDDLDDDGDLPPAAPGGKRPWKAGLESGSSSPEGGEPTEQAAKRRRVVGPGVGPQLSEPPLHLQLEEDDEDDAETLEEIASFVAGGGRPAQFVVEEEPAEAEEVIELEMNEGEITQKQRVEPAPAPGEAEAEYIMPDLDGAGAPHTPPEEMIDVKPRIVVTDEVAVVVGTAGSTPAQ